MKLEDIEMKGFLDELLQDDCHELEIENTELDGSVLIVEFSMGQAPRDPSDFFSEDCMRVDDPDSLEIDFDTGEHGDNGDAISLVRSAVTLLDSNNDLHDEYPANGGLDIPGNARLTVIMVGELYAGSYCDDESDAWLSGQILVEEGAGTRAIEMSQKICARTMEKTIEQAGNRLQNVIRLTRAMEGDDEKVRQVMMRVARVAFAA